MIITLTTDFGLKDGYVGAMKGVILSIAPKATIVDISHEVAPQDIQNGMRLLAAAVPYFPPGTIHLAVVDPGVGSERRPIVVENPLALFVGPDNGLLTPFMEAAGSPARCYHLDQPSFWLSRPSHTFHGRDIFAPVAAHLAAGVPVQQVGREIQDAVRLPLRLAVRRSPQEILGEVVNVDHFGNLLTNIPGDWLGNRAHGSWRFTVGFSPASVQVDDLRRTYAEVDPGELLALVGSSGWLEFAIRNGSAAAVLKLAAGAPVTAFRTRP